MTTRKLASAAAAASLAGVAVLGMAAAAAPALAQEVVNPGAVLPYNDTPDEPNITDGTPTAGQTITAGSGDNACPPNADADVAVPNTNIAGVETADDNGNVDFTFDAPNQPGNYQVVFSCAGETVSVPFTVITAAAGGSGQGNSALPRTGADSIVPLTITGLAMVAIGGGVVIAARRRREDMPGGTA